MPTTEEERLLITGVEGGSVAQRSKGLGELYERHSAEALRFAYLLTGDPQLAEDLVQDAFVRMIGRFADLRRADAFGTYLKRTIVNLSYGQFRRRRLERAYLERERALLNRDGIRQPDMEEHDEMIARLQKIAPRQRAVLVLRYYEDLSERQTAEALGCSVRTVKSLAARGMEGMRGQQMGEGS